MCWSPSWRASVLNICPFRAEQTQPKFEYWFLEFGLFPGKGVPLWRFIWSFSWFQFGFGVCFWSVDSREETVLGSIPLPSYVVSPVEPEDHISRKFAFKVSPSFSRVRVISLISGSAVSVSDVARSDPLLERRSCWSAPRISRVDFSRNKQLGPQSSPCGRKLSF